MRYIIIIGLFIASILNANELELSFLDTKSIGANEFILKNPEADGRGVIVYILDSGVDPSVRGLLQTSKGETKVVEMQDFTEQVKLKLNEAELNSGIVSYKDYQLEGADKLALKADGKYYIAVLDEKKCYQNSAVKDINNNGRKDDKILFLAFKPTVLGDSFNDAKGLVKPKENENPWVYFVDEDMDGHIDDETPKFNYKYRLDMFNFKKADSKSKPLLAFSANFDNKNKHLIINTNDNAHGTHCAGIATGFMINGQDGYNGIAPGAYVGSLKIGNDVLSGGATVTSSMKKAYEHGVKFMKDAGFKYAVYSMSYGIGSETPGRSKMEKFLEEFSEKHPEVIIVKSMGNSGPGINTVGNPSSVQSTLTVGAMISPETLQDLYGSKRKNDWVTHFSSRGGCVSQPDVIASGAAASTVPNYTRGDAFWGTSMSTPQVAGACALLFSAALKNNIEVDGFMLRKAIKYSAKKIKGYTSVDYGNGLVDINQAWEYLQVLSKRKEFDKLINYDIQTANSWYDDNKSNSIYWNVGGYFPKDEKQEVRIKAVFPHDMTQNEKTEFYRILSLKSDVDWLDIDKSKIYLKGEQGTKFNVTFNSKKLTKPGIYSGRVFGYTENEDNGGLADFDFQVTVVIPHKSNEGMNFSGKLDIGNIDRYFIEIPASATAMKISMEAENSNSDFAFYLYNPTANKKYYGQAKSGKSLNYTLSGNDLKRGVYELIPYCYYKSQNDLKYKLKVEFKHLVVEPNLISEIEYEIGEKPEIEVRLMNNSDDKSELKISGQISGYKKIEEYKQSGKKTFKKKFKVGDDIKLVKFKIDMDDEEFNKMTDVAVNVYNKSGKSMMSSGMSRKSGNFTFKVPAAGEYEFEIYPGFASKKELDSEWEFTVTKEYYYKTPITIKKLKLNVFPQKWYDLDLHFDNTYPTAPNGTMSFGEVIVKDENADVLNKVEIQVK